MPTINKLNKPVTQKPANDGPVKPTPDTSTVNVKTAEPVEHASAPLTESKGTMVGSQPSAQNIARVGNRQIALPSYLTQAMPEVTDRELTGYIGFCSDASKNYNEQRAAGLENGDIFLFHQGQFLKADQLEFFLATGESFKTVMASDGGFLAGTRDLNVKELSYTMGQPPRVQQRKADQYSNPKLEPHYVCLCIVNINGRLIPIKGDFRGTKSGGIESAISAVRAAGDANSGWLSLSEAHNATKAFPEPFGRVYHLMRTRAEVGKTSGMAYHRSVTVSQPATIQQMELLLDHLADPEFQALLEEAHTNYRSRISFLDSVINPKQTA